MITTGGQCGKIMNAVMGFVGQGYDMNESFKVRIVQKVQQYIEISASNASFRPPTSVELRILQGFYSDFTYIMQFSFTFLELKNA